MSLFILLFWIMPFAKLIYQYPIILIALFLELECGAFEDERACPADLQKVKGIKNQSSYMKNCTKSLVFQMCDCLFRYSKISLEQLRFVLIYKENLLLCMLIRKYVFFGSLLQSSTISTNYCLCKWVF